MNRAIVLGARPGNIGGAIVDHLNRSYGWNASADDCDMGTGYAAPAPKELEEYGACIITVGTTHMNPIGHQDARQIHHVIYGSLELPLACVASYVRARGDKGGKIILVGSYAHDHAFTHCTTYCAAKAGLDMAAKSLAWELMPDFNVHIIHPHHVQGTPMTEEVLKGMERGVHKMSREEALEYQRKDLKMSDILKPMEIAELVYVLLTEPVAAWLSGSGLNMYGGVR